MAFNYWFHPPDNLSGDVSDPYCSSFWQDGSNDHELPLDIDDYDDI